MSEAWNNWEVKPPPVCTTKTFLFAKEINEVKDIIYDASKTLGTLGYLQRETAILARYLYKSRRAYRHDKGTQNLVKIHQCLKKYLKINLLETINTFKESLPGKFPPEASHAHLPTKQMLKWVLMRLQAFSQIFNRIIEICKETGDHVYKKLFLGWSLNFTFFIFSIIARILVCSKFLLLKSIEWYNTLYKYLPYFEMTAEFLPDYKLPTDLKKWLGDVDIIPQRSKTPIDKMFEIIDLARDDVDGDDDEISIVNENLVKSWFKVITRKDTDEVEQEVEEEPEVTLEKIVSKKRSFPVTLDEDLGVPVEDDEISEIPRKKFKKKKFKKRWKNKHLLRNQKI